MIKSQYPKRLKSMLKSILAVLFLTKFTSTSSKSSFCVEFRLLPAIAVSLFLATYVAANVL